MPWNRSVGDLLNSVSLLAGFQGLVLGVVLASRRKDRLANRILAALVGALSLMLITSVVELRWGLSHPHLLGLGHALPFLFGPLLYLYVTALTRPARSFEARWLVHGLPFAADALYLFQIFYSKSAAEKLSLMQAYHAGEVPLPLRMFEILLVFQAISYLVATWLALRRHAARMEGYFSDVARIDLRWLKAMLAAHAVVWTIAALSVLLRAAGFDSPSQRGLSQAIQMGTALVVFATGYFSLWQPELFDKAQAAHDAEPTPRPLPKYQRNRLDDEEAAEIARKLTAQMTDRKLFRDGALTLQALADAVGATPHMVSQVLNLQLRKSFFTFVNSYRAEWLMAALADPALRERGVLELALDAGFNSKSTVNSFFKQYTGSTPTEFRLGRSQAKSARISVG